MIEQINKLKLRLQEQLPGQDAQYLMAPMHRKRIELEILKVSNYKPSAVMILICCDEVGELFIPLIERASYQGVHSAQISLPGGKFEEQDITLSNTAIRECFEEIGVGEVEIIGKLTPLYIPVSGFLVEPYVGVCRIKNPTMISQEREVNSILKLNMNDLLREEIVENGTIELQSNLKIQANWFNLHNHRIWGATAMILSEWKETIKDVF